MVDEVFKSEFLVSEHTGELAHRLSQPTEDLILSSNAELRKNKGAIRDLSFGRQVASIPLIMWEKAILDGYQLNCKDKPTREREMNRFLRSEDGKKCLVY